MLLHTILNERFGISMGKVMRLLISAFFALFVIAFAGTSTAQSQEARNPPAEDVSKGFYRLLPTPMSTASLIYFRRMRSFGVLAQPS